jgi:hypothetical protein
MLSRMFAALIALVPATALSAQATGVPATDFRTAPVLPGTWSYHPLPGGSEARFVDTTGTARLVIHCTRATRRVGISPTSSAPAPTIAVWTTIAMRSLPARFEANAMRVTAELPAFDPMLDAIAFSRGRFAVTLAGGTSLVVPALVIPSGPEAARTVEDCRN